MIGDVPKLEATDFSGDDGNCSSWSVVTGSSNGTDVTAATTQQSVSVATQVGPASSSMCTVHCADLTWSVSAARRAFALAQEMAAFVFNIRWRLVHVVENPTRINPSFRANLVFSQVDGGFFTPGTAYYVRVSAINSAGTSEAQEAETKDLCGEVDQACSPRAPPPPPVDAKVPLTHCSKWQCDARTLNV